MEREEDEDGQGPKMGVRSGNYSPGTAARVGVERRRTHQDGREEEQLELWHCSEVAVKGCRTRQAHPSHGLSPTSECGIAQSFGLVRQQD